MSHFIFNYFFIIRIANTPDYHGMEMTLHIILPHVILRVQSFIIQMELLDKKLKSTSFLSELLYKNRYSVPNNLVYSYSNYDQNIFHKPNINDDSSAYIEELVSTSPHIIDYDTAHENLINNANLSNNMFNDITKYKQDTFFNNNLLTSTNYDITD
jgi:hypothetical protein